LADTVDKDGGSNRLNEVKELARPRRLAGTSNPTPMKCLSDIIVLLKDIMVHLR
jgi:hypothetical protein